MSKTNIVTAYKAGYSTRITIPKRIFNEFARVGFNHNGHHWPLLVLRTNTNNKPYFDNCDFGLDLFVGSTEDFMKAYTGLVVYETGKNKANRYFILPNQSTKQLAVNDKTKLQVDIAENTKPSDNFYNKIIAYTVLRQT